jgi:hypothetical protein
VFPTTPWLVFLAPATALPSPAATLEAIVGTWKSDQVISHCDWSPDHRWVICDQKGTADGKPVDALSLYGYSPTRKEYVFFTIPEGNKTAWGATLRIDGKRWTYVANDADAAKRFRTINEFSTGESYKWEVQQSSDGGQHWNVVKSGTSTRMK